MFDYFTRYKQHPERNLFGDLMPWILIFAVLCTAGVAGIRFYRNVMRPNVNLHGQAQTYLYIPTGAGFETLTRILSKQDLVKNLASFEWLAIRKHYDTHVHPGRYRITAGMSNNMLINQLRSGKQEMVRVTFQSARTNAELAGKIGKHLETDSAALIRLFNNTDYLGRYALTPATLLVIFIPNTYEFVWNTSGDQLFERMVKEYNHFWTTERKAKASALNLTRQEVVTLASILEKETNKNDEKPVIAGVYLNRLRKKMPLQADPTVIYAWNDYSIKRVLNKHTEIKSVYNTYLHTGLPPGPICIPSVASVDAVLNHQEHRYLYFCAREDLSGYHNFAATLAQHNANAKKYQKELNNRHIK